MIDNAQNEVRNEEGCVPTILVAAVLLALGNTEAKSWLASSYGQRISFEPNENNCNAVLVNDPVVGIHAQKTREPAVFLRNHHFGFDQIGI